MLNSAVQSAAQSFLAASKTAATAEGDTILSMSVSINLPTSDAPGNLYISAQFKPDANGVSRSESSATAIPVGA